MIAGRALSRGQHALRRGDLERALEHFAAATSASPTWSLARLWLGTAASEAGDLERACGELERAIELTDGATVPHIWLARALIDHEEYEAALDALEPVLSAAKDNLHVTGFQTLARWGATGEVDALVECGWEVGHGGGNLWGRWLVEIETRFPGGPGVEFFGSHEPPVSPLQRLACWRSERHRARAARRIGAKDYLKALADINRADAIWVGSDEALELRLQAHRGAAVMRAEQLCEAPHDVDLRLDLAEDLMELGDVSEALCVLEPAEEHIRSIDADRLSWRATLALLRGRAHLSAGASKEAITDLVLARELWPVEIEPVYYHGVALLHANQRAAGRHALIDGCYMDGSLAQIRLDEFRAAMGE